MIEYFNEDCMEGMARSETTWNGGGKVRYRMKLTKEFLKFMETIREGEALGEIKFSKPITDFDLAVQFAIGKLFEKGIRNMTAEDICRAMIENCGEDSFELQND